jgi:hypothetical protein
MKRLSVFLLAVLPLLAAGCGDNSPAVEPKVPGQAKRPVGPVGQATQEKTPVDKNGKQRSLTPDY